MTTQTVPADMWLITEITHRDPRDHYRLHVAGLNTSHDPPQTFAWQVPDIDDARFVPHPSAPPDVREAVFEAKNIRFPQCSICRRRHGSERTHAAE